MDLINSVAWIKIHNHNSHVGVIYKDEKKGLFKKETSQMVT